jgi:type IV secretory pathway component VirB8
MKRARDRHVERQIKKHRPEVIAVMDGLVQESTKLARSNTTLFRVVIFQALIHLAMAGVIIHLINR